MNCIETFHFKILVRNKTTSPVKHAMILQDRAYCVIYYVAHYKRAVGIRVYCKIRNTENTSREMSVTLKYFAGFLCFKMALF